MNYQRIFNQYNTSQGIPFTLLSKSITFPQDDNLQIYQFMYSSQDVPWTIFSYKLYGTIDYWWVLSLLNKNMKFYAERGKTIRIIKPSMLEQVIKYI